MNKSILSQLPTKEFWQELEELDFLSPEDINDLRKELEEIYDLDTLCAN